MRSAALLCAQLAFATEGTGITHQHKRLAVVRVAVCDGSDEQSTLQRTQLRAWQTTEATFE